jgi:hypothetical protein
MAPNIRLSFPSSMSQRQFLCFVCISFLPLCLSCGGGGEGGGFNGIPAEMIPNLRPEKASSLSIENTDTGSGVQRVLRMASRISNYGAGPMELFGNISGAQQGEIVPGFQIIRWNNGDTTTLPAGDFEFHPQHNHWHWENLVTFKLLQAMNAVDPYDPANTLVGANPKVSFCLIDSSRISPFGGPGQPGSPQYSTCNANTQGISVGWSDIYAAFLFGQWIVIEGVADGIYWIVLECDPLGLLQETDETDNRSAVKVQITGNSVTVLP